MSDGWTGAVMKPFKLIDPLQHQPLQTPTALPHHQRETGSMPWRRQQHQHQHQQRSIAPSVLSDDESGDETALISRRSIEQATGTTCTQSAPDSVSFVKPSIELQAYEELISNVTLVTRHGGNLFCPFSIPLPDFILSEHQQNGRFRVLVEELDLVAYSCSESSADCILRMDSPLLRNATPSAVFFDDGTSSCVPVATPMGVNKQDNVTCHLPFGQLSGPPRQLYRWSAEQQLKPEQCQREYRYARYESSADMMAELCFDESNTAHGAAVSPAARLDMPSLALSPRKVPLPPIYVLYWMNRPAVAVQAERDGLNYVPTREDFSQACSVVDSNYFERDRKARLYASQLSGRLCTQRPCVVKMTFRLKLIRLVLCPSTDSATPLELKTLQLVRLPPQPSSKNQTTNQGPK